MSLMRRRVAQAAMQRKDIERQLTELEPPPAPAGLRSGSRGGRGGGAAGRRVPAGAERVDAFRTRKEVLKAAHTAARAEQLIDQAQDAEEDAVRPEDPAGAASALTRSPARSNRSWTWRAPAGGLMELRPGAPADSGLRILFAVEPPGTALLIAVLEGGDAVRDHYREAVLLASGVLREARAGGRRGGRAHVRRRPVVPGGVLPGRADELR